MGDGGGLLVGALLFACARACCTKSSDTAASSNEPRNLVAFLSDSTCLLIGLVITGSPAFVLSIHYGYDDS
jgi:hypothetical protein